MKERCEKAPAMFWFLSQSQIQASMPYHFQAAIQLESVSLYLEGHFWKVMKALVL